MCFVGLPLSYLVTLEKNKKLARTVLASFLFFYPRITLMIIIMIAITRSIWINPPRTGNPMKPSSQRMSNIIAIVVSIENYLYLS
jgi:hypothetical protein